MARRIRNAKTDSRSARLKLKIRREPYWAALGESVAIGYRRGPGRWIARKYDTAATPPLTYQALGGADDISDDQGLSFDAAATAAREWAGRPGARATGPYTVADAMRDYLAAYERGDTKFGGRGARTVRSAINARILPALGLIDANELTAEQMRDWLRGVAKSGRLARAAANGKRRKSVAPDSPEAIRRSRNAANRIRNVLIAGLNWAFTEGKIASDREWKRFKPFGDVDAPVVRYLSKAECSRLVNACPADFRKLVQAAILTGARYGELTALACGDFNPDTGRLLIRISKTGKARHVGLDQDGERFFTDLTAGRDPKSLMFTRDSGEPWQPSDKRRPLQSACKAARIAPAIGFHVLRHTHASLLAMAGTELFSISKQLGHASTRMTEKHYAHLSPEHVANEVRANFPKLGIVEPSPKVAGMRRR